MDYEHILLQKKGVKVYNIPPMTSNKGHFLDSWKNKITELNLKVTAKGHKCVVHLINYDGTPFASAPITDNYEQSVVKCVDSSRGFALRVQDPSGRNAWLGIGFTERNDSFDFQACFQDFEKTRDMELNPEKYAAENKPTQDFSLKKGEKITFNVASGGSNKPRSNFTGDLKLAPPPGSTFGLPPPQNDRPAPQFNQASNNAFTNNTSNNNAGFDSFGSFGGFGSNQTSNQGSGQSNNLGNQGGFGGFQSWGQPQTQQPTTQNNANSFDLLGDVNFSSQPTNNNTNTNTFNQQNNNNQGGGFNNSWNQQSNTNNQGGGFDLL